MDVGAAGATNNGCRVGTDIIPTELADRGALEKTELRVMASVSLRTRLIIGDVHQSRTVQVFVELRAGWVALRET